MHGMKKFFWSALMFSYVAMAQAQSPEDTCFSLIQKQKDVPPVTNYHFGLTGSSSNQQRLLQCIQTLKLSGQAGNLLAQKQLAEVYYYGYVAPTNFRESFYWYQQAATQGDKTAQYQLGSFYEQGRGTHKNHTEALHWYSLAAEQHYTPAYLKIAESFRYGKGLPKNPDRALTWYRRAAEAGDLSAQYKLGNYLTELDMNHQRLPEAYAWLSIATNRGSWLSELYLNQLMRKMSFEEIKEGKRLVDSLQSV